MSQTAQAVENALKGEKTFQTVQFAITGDSETDLIAGVLAVVNARIYGSTQQLAYGPPASAYWAAHRVLMYLSNRFKAEAEIAQGREDSYRQMTQPIQSVGQSALGVSGLGGKIYGGNPLHQPPLMNQATMTPEQRRQAIEAMGMTLGEMKP